MALHHTWQISNSQTSFKHSEMHLHRNTHAYTDKQASSSRHTERHAHPRAGPPASTQQSRSAVMGLRTPAGDLRSHSVRREDPPTMSHLTSMLARVDGKNSGFFCFVLFLIKKKQQANHTSPMSHQFLLQCYPRGDLLHVSPISFWR